MARNWRQERRRDPYIRRAQAQGYRSRAAYKLLEIQHRTRLLRRGMVVVDLGAAPGGWSQVAAHCTGREGLVVALDCLEMAPLPGVRCLRADFTAPEAPDRLHQVLAGRVPDLVISDLAPNISGVRASDQAAAAQLALQVLAYAVRVLRRPGGRCLLKAFQGADFAEIQSAMDASFRALRVLKPEASQSRSRELYLLGEIDPAVPAPR